MSEGIGVYKAIAAVQGELATEGISKDRTCTQGASYKFRGIDDVYNALAPILAKHNLCIIPRMLTRELVERQSKAGGALFYTVIEAEFDFVSAEDGSKHTARTIGEAMDSGDKGCNKAMSAAYKYAAFQTFCIPTEGDNDTENQTHEVAPRKQEAPQLNEAQKKYFPRIADALDIAFGADQKAKDAKIIELTTWTKNKDTDKEEVVKGNANYRLIKTEKTLEILCHKVEAIAKKAVKQEAVKCADCGEIDGHDITCPNFKPSEDIQY